MTTPMDEETRLKLTGLRAIADDINKQLETIARTAADIVGEPREAGTAYYGHSSDFAYDKDITPDELWARTEKCRTKDAA